MTQTMETFREVTTSLDRRYANNRSVRWITAALIAECLASGIMVASKEGPDHSKNVSVRQEAVFTAAHDIKKLPAVHPTAVAPHHKHAAAAPKPKPHHTPTSIRPHQSKGYTQVRLPSRPRRMIASSHQFASAQREAKPFFDISYPNCDPTKRNDRFKGIISDGLFTTNMPVIENGDAAIIGVTGGKNFTSNWCLKNELKLTPKYDLYVNSGYPGYEDARIFQNAPNHCAESDRLCVAKNYGIQTGRYALQLLKRAGAYAPGEFWIDVETANSWDGSFSEHRAALEGEREALQAANPNVRVGFYSVPNVPADASGPARSGMWQRLTGGWKNGADTWIATGTGDPQEALAACDNRESFTGGAVIYSQYTRTFDQNVRCP